MADAVDESSSSSNNDMSHFDVLPLSATEGLEAQTARYRHDFEAAVSLIPTARIAGDQSRGPAEDSFKYAWLIVNTRCLFFDPFPRFQAETGRARTKRLHASHDSTQSMALSPLIDLLNHSSSSSTTPACKVTYDHSGFSVTSQKAYRVGEELLVSYGPHTNDFLLVEYGFILPSTQNTHDLTSLDAAIIPTLTSEQKCRLDAKAYLGQYSLFSPQATPGTKASVCWRTEVAAQITILPPDDWLDFVDGRAPNDESASTTASIKSHAQISAWIEHTRSQALTSLTALSNLILPNNPQKQDQGPLARTFDLVDDDPGSLSTPTRSIGDSITRTTRLLHLAHSRWTQIFAMCDSFLER